MVVIINFMEGIRRPREEAGSMLPSFGRGAAPPGEAG